MSYSSVMHLNEYVPHIHKTEKSSLLLLQHQHTVCEQTDGLSQLGWKVTEIRKIENQPHRHPIFHLITTLTKKISDWKIEMISKKYQTLTYIYIYIYIYYNTNTLKYIYVYIHFIYIHVYSFYNYIYIYIWVFILNMHIWVYILYIPIYMCIHFIYIYKNSFYIYIFICIFIIYIYIYIYIYIFVCVCVCVCMINHFIYIIKFNVCVSVNTKGNRRYLKQSIYSCVKFYEKDNELHEIYFPIDWWV